ncbi:MAG TPA: type 2 lanthipeptide synthetase LanM family protein [Pseudolabrys sp.]|nr:type 2 lanthipeptide synthetase LanM family protein [Pseudolabrys sp.]
MDAYFERLAVSAATIDELLSGDFEPLANAHCDAALAERRLAAWRHSSAGGDQSLFARRLQRDGHDLTRVQTLFGGATRRTAAAAPAWITDASWLVEALQAPAGGASPDPCAFEELLAPVADRAAAHLWADINGAAAENLTAQARAGLRHSLLHKLSELAAPALYECFAGARKSGSSYAQFVAHLKAGGVRAFFADRPVLLRLMATVARQWIDATREMVQRVHADLPLLRREFLRATDPNRVAACAADLSDAHNDGRAVTILTFEDGARLVYKPKDLRLDAAWHELIARLNQSSIPIALKAARVLARDGYGWAEFIAHTGTDTAGCERYFRRAGAWLALLHCFAANDMHQENIIACGEHPVPIDLETILQPPETHEAPAPEDAAFAAAVETLANSVMAVGLLPAYGRSPDNKVFAIGGMTANWSSRIRIAWENINSDAMRPTRANETRAHNPNLPHVGGRYAKFSDHTEAFVAGFTDCAKFLAGRTDLFDGFAGAPVRRVVRPTRFYSMLLLRLRDYRKMDDGIIWSAQADFLARLADWDKDDPLWPVQRAERAALLALNVPHFISLSDGNDICDAAGFVLRAGTMSGLARARARAGSLDAQEIAWQADIICENAIVKRPGIAVTEAPDLAAAPAAPDRAMFVAEAGRIAEELSRYAIRRGPGAAWIGLDWLGDAEVFQLVCLGADLYNGASGIALFLAAHARVTASESSHALGLAALTRLRKSLRSRTAARMARALGLGGATGLGSVVYALTTIAQFLDDKALLADAETAAALFTDELIAADRQLDVISGSAGGILGLLRLYRDTQSGDALRRAVKCGEHLMAQSRAGPQGRRSWVGLGLGAKPLNGMSHGAAGFAYALAALAAAAQRDDFAEAASECIAFEDSTYDATHHNWPDLRGAEPSWPCQWCHGASGIGLARLGVRRRGQIEAVTVSADVHSAVEGATRAWPGTVDTLCCGTLGSIEFLCEAGAALGRADLRALAAQRLAAVLNTAAAKGDYRWNSGQRRFNLGLFRGLAGVGYTALRLADAGLPNVLIWE